MQDIPNRSTGHAHGPSYMEPGRPQPCNKQRPCARDPRFRGGLPHQWRVPLPLHQFRKPVAGAKALGVVPVGDLVKPARHTEILYPCPPVITLPLLMHHVPDRGSQIDGSTVQLPPVERCVHGICRYRGRDGGHGL
jgi:hypothetical protein